MNWLIVTLGTVIVLLLGAALVGPVFVDWTAYRAELERGAERVLGINLTFAGAADVRLLPTPTVTLSNITVGSEEAPVLTADEITARLEIAPLFSREVRLLDLTIDAPEAVVRIGPDGTLDVPSLTADERVAGFVGDSLAIETITVTDGAVTVDDARTGQTHRLTDIALAGNLRGTLGPFNAAGTFAVNGSAQTVRISGGSITADGTMAASIRLQPVSEAFALTLDGVFAPDRRVPVFTGELGFDTAGLSAAGAVTVNPERIELRSGQAVIGSGERTVDLVLSAGLNMISGEPAMVRLAAAQIDLDRLSGRADEDAVWPPAEAAPALLGPVIERLSALPDAGRDVVVELSIGTIVFGGSVVRDVAAVVASDGEVLALEDAEAALPGGTDIRLTGTMGEAFDGRLRATASQPAALVRWWTGGDVPVAGFDPILVIAPIRIGPDRLRSSGFSVRMGRSSATGTLDWSAQPNGPPSIDVSLAAPFLDARDLIALAGLSGAAPRVGEAAIDILIDRIAVGPVEGDAVTVDAAYRDGNLTIDAIRAEDVAGAGLLMRGEIANLEDAPAGSISGELTLNDGTAFAEALTALFPVSPAAARLADAAPRLAPGNLQVTVAGSPGDADAELSASLSGTLAGTRIDVSASGAPFRDEPSLSAATVMVETQTAAELLAQLSLANDEVAADGPLAIDLSVDGPSLSDTGLSARIEGLGATAAFHGRASLGANVAFSGPLSFQTRSLERLADAASIRFPVDGAAELSASLAPDDASGVTRVNDLKGTIADVAFEGDLAIAPEAITGALRLEEADLATMATAILGPGAAHGDETWSTSVFGDPLFLGTGLEIELTTPTLTLGPVTMTDVAADLLMSQTTLGLQNVEGRLADGAAAGDVTITRTGPGAALSAQVTLARADLTDLIWQADGSPVATGRLDLTADVTAEGFTMAGLAANLTGTGRLELMNGTIARLNPAPFGLMTTALQTEDLPPEGEVRDELERHLDAADLSYERIAADLTIDGGVVNLRNVTIDAQSPALFEEAAIDLSTRSLQSAFALDLPVPEGEAPMVSLTFAGPLDAPERTIAVGTLMDWLELKRLERQVQTFEAENEALAAEAEARDALGDQPTPAQPPAPDPPSGNRSDAESATDPIGTFLRTAERDAGGAASDYEARRAQRGTVREDLLRSQDRPTPQATEPFRLTPSDVPN